MARRRSHRISGSFLRNAQGVGMIEFAFALPVLLLLFAGVVELTRFVLANQKVDKSAASLADFLGQQEDPQGFDEKTLASAFGKLLEPFKTKNAGFIASGVVLQNNKSVIAWRKTYGRVGASRVGGGVGGPADINDIELQPGETAIAVEVFFRHSTILDNVGKINAALDFNNEELYKLSVVLQRVPPTPPEGSPQPMTKLYGCCGEYCNPGDMSNPSDTDYLPPCICLDYPVCEENASVPGSNQYYWHRLYGCKLRTCGGGGAPPATDICDDPAYANTCRCDKSKCKNGGV